MSGLLGPVPLGRVSTFRAHLQRDPASVEPGTDFYCERGTPIRAAGRGRVVAVGGTVQAATGRYLTIDLDDGRRVRYLHLLTRYVITGARVERGDVVALSGASGYGSEHFGATSDYDPIMLLNTGGPHVHMTLWPSHREVYNDRRSRTFDGTLDPQEYTDEYPGGQLAGEEEDDMFSDEDRRKLDVLYDRVPVIDQITRRLETQVSETRTVKTLASRIWDAVRR